MGRNGNVTVPKNYNFDVDVFQIIEELAVFAQ